MGKKRKLAALVAAVAIGVGYYVNTASAGTVNAPRAVTSKAAPNSSPPPRVFAVLNPDGSKLRGKAVASTQKLSTGTYDVRFLRNISNCAWTGTVGFGTFGGSTGPAYLTITGRSGTNNGLFVQTFNSAGTLTDEPSTELVTCS